MKSWRSGSEHGTLMHPARTSATGAGVARAPTPTGLVRRSARPPGRTPAGAGEGPVLGRGAAGRGGAGPSSLAKCQTHPLLS